MIDGGALRRGMPLYKWLANRALSWLENRCYDLDLSEYHSGMMAYSRDALERLPWRFVSDTFHIDGELAIRSRDGRRCWSVVAALDSLLADFNIGLLAARGIARLGQRA